MKENKRQRKDYRKTLMLIIIMALLSVTENTFAQDGTTYMRIAKLVVDSAQLQSFTIALKEQMKSALTLEKGVLAYSSVYAKNNPSHITLLETYTSVSGYQAHIQTDHFKKYKTIVEHMLTSLKLTGVMPMAVEKK